VVLFADYCGDLIPSDYLSLQHHHHGGITSSHHGGNGGLLSRSASSTSAMVSGKLWNSRQPGICPICQRVFSNKFNLKQHIINIHTTGEGVECDSCHKMCKNKWYLRRHQVTHHGAPLRRIKTESHSGIGVTRPQLHGVAPQ